MLALLSLLAPVYLFVVPMLAAAAPQQSGVGGVIFGAFMLIQLWMLVGVFAFDTAAEFYNYRPPRFFRVMKMMGNVFDPHRVNVRSRGSASWAIVPMMLSYSAFNYAFAVIYVFISSIEPASFSTGKPLGVVEAIYFSAITAATVGYGDIAPKSDIARLAVVAQVSLSLIYVVTLFSAFASHLRDHASPKIGKTASESELTGAD